MTLFPIRNMAGGGSIDNGHRIQKETSLQSLSAALLILNPSALAPCCRAVVKVAADVRRRNKPRRFLDENPPPYVGGYTFPRLCHWPWALVPASMSEFWLAVWQTSFSRVTAPNPHQRIGQGLLENAAVAVAGAEAEDETVMVTFGS